MTTTRQTRLEIKSWDEKPYRELPDGRTLKRADVVLSGGDDQVRLDATWEALLYYGPDGSSSYVGLMHATGTLDGRDGSFIMIGTGTFAGTQARITSEVVPGSGTGGLTGITGTCVSVSTHADYPYWPMTLTYDLE